MNIRSPLLEEDILAFTPSSSRKVVARIYKNEQWFTGHLFNITVLSTECKLKVEPIIKFVPHYPHFDLIDHCDVLVGGDDKIVPKSLSEKSLPFTLDNPVVITPRETMNDIIIIGFTDGTALLSARKEDVQAVDDFLELARNTSR